MKKIYILASALLFSNAFSQHFCAYDEVQQQLEARNPEIKKTRLAVESKVRSMNLSALKKTAKITTTNTGAYSGPIYTIPVVVHVIESSIASQNPTDEEVKNWIESANKQYATTFGGEYFPEGTGAMGGTVIPFRLELAQRTPNCEATNGIIRYKGYEKAPSYDANGLNR